MHLTDKIFYDQERHSVCLNGLELQELNKSNITTLSTHLYNLKLKKNSPLKIAAMGEGLPVKFIQIFNILIKECIEMLNANVNDFIYEMGGEDIPKNYEFYNKEFDKFNLIKIPIKFLGSSFERIAFEEIEKRKEIFDSMNKNITYNQKKLFLSFNHAPRDHRIYIFYKMIELGILDKCFASFLFDNSMLNALRSSVPTTFPNLKDKIIQVVESNINLLPMFVDGKEIKEQMQSARSTVQNNVRSEEFYFYENSYISLIGETKFHPVNETVYSDQFDVIFFSEKTWKPIQARHPFIMFGMQYSLQTLRDKGYRTFHPYIDESYDTIENHEHRIMAIGDELNRLSKFTQDEWFEFSHNIQPIVDHNFNKLSNYGNSLSN